MKSYILANTDAEFEQAKIVFREYADELCLDLSFQNFEEELKSIKTQYGKPDGGILLIKSNEEIIGCIGVRKLENNIGELKRMYIKKAFRSKGFGKELLNKAIDLARELNYKKLRLDTLPTMNKAIKLYKEKGFVEIEAYRYNPVSGTIFFELEIE